MSKPAELSVDTTSPVPPFEQLRAQLAELIRHGVLRPGDRMPPVRQLAADLGLAVGTVARAYREIKHAGLIRSRRGAGTTVATPAEPSTSADRARLLADRAARYVADARRLGATDDALRAAVHDALNP